MSKKTQSTVTTEPTKTVWKFCVGGGIQPKEKPCPHSKTGMHEVMESGDTNPYNGIRNWRCDECFREHREAVRQENS